MLGHHQEYPSYLLSLFLIMTFSSTSSAHMQRGFATPPTVNSEYEVHDALDALERQHNNIAKTLRAHDVEIRKNCLLIWGITARVYDATVLIDEVLRVINNVLNVPTVPEEVDFCFKSRENSDKRDMDTVPHLVRFTTFNKKKQVLRHAHEMLINNDTYRVDNYLNYDDIMMIESEPYFTY